MRGEAVELVAVTAGDEMPPYERLLGDAMRGDPMLFVREDSVEAAWKVVGAVLWRCDTGLSSTLRTPGGHPRSTRSSRAMGAGTTRY